MATTQPEREFFGPAFAKDVTELEVLWGAAQRRLEVLARDPAFLSANDLSFAQARASTLMAEVNTTLAGLRANTIEWTRGSVPTATTVGSDAAVASALAQGFNVNTVGALGVVNTAGIRVISEDILNDLDFAIDSSRRNMRRHFRASQQILLDEAAINTSLLLSEARLENANARGRRLQRLFASHAASGQLININGRFWRLSTYADLIARTRLTEATTEAAFRSVVSMGIDTVRISDHGRTDKFCDPFAGKVFSISGRDKRFPILTERPPFHPRCRHALLPFVSDLQSNRELEFAVARSAGRIEAGVSFEEFFRASA